MRTQAQYQAGLLVVTQAQNLAAELLDDSQVQHQEEELLVRTQVLQPAELLEKVQHQQPAELLEMELIQQQAVR